MSILIDRDEVRCQEILVALPVLFDFLNADWAYSEYLEIMFFEKIPKILEIRARVDVATAKFELYDRYAISSFPQSM